MNTSYSKWDKWADSIDDDGEEKTTKENETPRPKCVFGKPMTEEEFLKRDDAPTAQLISADNLSKAPSQ